jgi:hypothetical protein
VTVGVDVGVFVGVGVGELKIAIALPHAPRRIGARRSTPMRIMLNLIQ